MALFIYNFKHPLENLQDQFNVRRVIDESDFKYATFVYGNSKINMLISFGPASSINEVKITSGKILDIVLPVNTYMYYPLLIRNVLKYISENYVQSQEVANYMS